MWYEINHTTESWDKMRVWLLNEWPASVIFPWWKWRDRAENPNWMKRLNMLDMNICKRVTYKCLSKNLDRVKKTPFSHLIGLFLWSRWCWLKPVVICMTSVLIRVLFYLNIYFNPLKLHNIHVALAKLHNRINWSKNICIIHTYILAACRHFLSFSGFLCAACIGQKRVFLQW